MTLVPTRTVAQTDDYFGTTVTDEGRSHDALIAERTDVLAFLSQHTGLSWR